MILIGMFDSPFVRRVAISMQLLGIDFEHRNWSVGRDQAAIREFNPLGRVPTLVLDAGEALIESSAILDWLDEQAGARALLPQSGALRRQGLRLMAMATGAADKTVAQIYERNFRPEEKWHQPWLDRCHEQMENALKVLDEACAAQAPGGWLLGPTLQQPDITLACVYTFISETMALDSSRYPALAAHTARCEALPEFRATHVPFFTPKP